MLPTVGQIQRALEAAGAAHHQYEQHVLRGRRDEQWAGWYAAYVLGRLGDVATPAVMTAWMAETETARPWAPEAAQYLRRCLEKASSAAPGS